MAFVMQTLELDPGNTVAIAKTKRLEPIVTERREKMKDEMMGGFSLLLGASDCTPAMPPADTHRCRPFGVHLSTSDLCTASGVAPLSPCSIDSLLRLFASTGKLKELGNSVLGKFGMSLDNFKAVQDPATGSYSINFQQ